MKTVSTEQISSQKKIKKDIKETIVMNTSGTNSPNKNSRVKKNTKTRLSVITLLVLLAVFSTAVFSATTSASSLDKFFENNLPAPIASGLSRVSNAVFGTATVNNASVSSAPAVTTEQTGYLGGESIAITGSGFAPIETVNLRVKHADGTAEDGMGHELFSVVTDQSGNFTATWSINPNDIVSSKFNLTAEGASSSAATEFNRMAYVETDKFDYLAGDTAQITGMGFKPSEQVTKINNRIGSSEFRDKNESHTFKYHVPGKELKS
jgi:hypothetical protein